MGVLEEGYEEEKLIELSAAFAIMLGWELGLAKIGRTIQQACQNPHKLYSVQSV